MTIKIDDMKNVSKLISAAVLLFLFSACGSSSKEEKGALTDKKTKLEKLKSDRDKIDGEIKALEEEIAKIDTSAALSKGKLVAALPVAEQNFEHYIDLQGHVDADNISYATPRGTPLQVKAVYIKKGDFVKKGQMLMKLDDALQLTVLQQQKTQLSQAEDIYRRKKNLWDQGIGTE